MIHNLAEAKISNDTLRSLSVPPSPNNNDKSKYNQQKIKQCPPSLTEEEGVLTVVCDQEKDVMQNPSILNVWERQTTVITCNYTDGALNYFPLYKKEAEKNSTLLIEIHSSMDRKQDRRFTVLLNKKFNMSPCMSQPPNQETQPCTSVQGSHRALRPLQPAAGAPVTCFVLD
ncbi:hypothetical protein HPG69_002148 [Diceros bicornis minor]|uniref:Uncharacterized protein n=1 Tax=Diceros bicornis minor TaxID=77932 RepID=A0A7J7FCS4_DICBM|nr:hypothetical protein HPG69_002148 [Diceros bicornis minor]